MKVIRLLFMVMFVTISLSAVAQRIKFDIWGTGKMHKATSTLVGDVDQNFLTAYLDGNSLQLNGRRYILANKRVSYEGFSTYTRYDVVDNTDRRGFVVIINDTTAHKMMQNAIVVQYEGDEYAYWFYSNKPTSY